MASGEFRDTSSSKPHSSSTTVPDIPFAEQATLFNTLLRETPCLELKPQRLRREFNQWLGKATNKASSDSEELVGHSLPRFEFHNKEKKRRTHT